MLGEGRLCSFNFPGRALILETHRVNASKQCESIPIKNTERWALIRDTHRVNTPKKAGRCSLKLRDRDFLQTPPNGSHFEWLGDPLASRLHSLVHVLSDRCTQLSPCAAVNPVVELVHRWLVVGKLVVPTLVHTVSFIQRRPVRVMYDAYMHHGQNRGSQKT